MLKTADLTFRADFSNVLRFRTILKWFLIFILSKINSWLKLIDKMIFLLNNAIFDGPLWIPIFHWISNNDIKQTLKIEIFSKRILRFEMKILDENPSSIRAVGSLTISENKITTIIIINLPRKLYGPAFFVRKACFKRKENAGTGPLKRKYRVNVTLPVFRIRATVLFNSAVVAGPCRNSPRTLK